MVESEFVDNPRRTRKHKWDNHIKTLIILQYFHIYNNYKSTINFNYDKIISTCI